MASISPCLCCWGITRKWGRQAGTLQQGQKPPYHRTNLSCSKHLIERSSDDPGVKHQLSIWVKQHTVGKEWGAYGQWRWIAPPTPPHPCSHIQLCQVRRNVSVFPTWTYRHLCTECLCLKNLHWLHWLCSLHTIILITEAEYREKWKFGAL